MKAMMRRLAVLVGLIAILAGLILDEMHSKFIRCFECGYLLPISCPIYGCGNIAFVEDSE